MMNGWIFADNDRMHAVSACDRRSFLKGAALAGAVAACPSLLAGCGGSSTSLRSEPLSSEPTLEQKIAQMLLVGFRGTVLDERNYIVRDIRDHRIGGVILFDRDAKLGTSGRNIISPEQTRALTASLQALSETPLFIAVDQEGGNVARLRESCGFPPTVTARYLGTRNDHAVTSAASAGIAATLAGHGFTMNFAPVLDLNVNPASPAIGAKERSFSADPAVVSAHARLFVEAHDRKGIATCSKHFPGHGSASNDSHLGFDGVVVTDDLQMKGLAQFFDYRTIVERSIQAGVDIILVSNNLEYDPEVVPTTIDHVRELVRTGTVTERRIDESYRRIMTLKRRLAVG